MAWRVKTLEEFKKQARLNGTGEGNWRNVSCSFVSEMDEYLGEKIHALDGRTYNSVTPATVIHYKGYSFSYAMLIWEEDIMCIIDKTSIGTKGDIVIHNGIGKVISRTLQDINKHLYIETDKGELIKLEEILLINKRTLKKIL